MRPMSVFAYTGLDFLGDFSGRTPGGTGDILATENCIVPDESISACPSVMVKPSPGESGHVGTEPKIRLADSKNFS